MNRVQPMPVSPLKWVGGKRALRRQIIDMLPSDAVAYVEVFCGASWVLFGKQPHQREVLNDADGDLCNLWRVLKWRPAELLERVHQHLYSREMFLELREQRPDGNDEMGRAVWLYLLMQMSFGGDISDKETASFAAFRVRNGDLFSLKAERLFEPSRRRLANAIIENRDFEPLIRHYDAAATVFFCDPPYLETSGYRQPFDLDDHRRLASALREIDGRFLLTINDHPVIRDLYSGYHLLEAAEARSLAAGPAGKSAPVLIITNYDTVPHQAKGLAA